MNKTHLSILLAAAMATLAPLAHAGVAKTAKKAHVAKSEAAAAAAEELNMAENYEAAQANVPEDGYVLALYAEDWDKFSKKTVKAFYKNKAFKQEMANSVIIEYAAPNFFSSPTKENPDLRDCRKERETKLGKLKWTGAHTYPAFVLYDKNGRHYATVLVPYADRKNPEKIAKQIAAARKALAEQNELLAQAEKESGLAKAKLLGKAASFSNINRPDNIVKRIKEVDPEDKSGYVRSLDFNGHAYAEGTSKTKDWKATLAEVEAKIADKSYTDAQRQGLYATAIGLLHRHGTVADQKKLVKYLRAMEKLDPDSILGISAERAEMLWVVDLSYADGWSPAVLPTDTTPTEVKGPLPIKEAGTYTVTFSYTRGAHQLVVLGVELYDGNKKVAEDIHRGSTGVRQDKNVYTLEVSSAVKNPVLKVSLDMTKSRDSYGTIRIEKK